MSVMLEPAVTLPWLVRLRWLYAIGQLVVLGILTYSSNHVVIWPFVVVALLVGVSNWALSTRAVATPRVIGAVLVLDTVLLTFLLAAEGGATNPFTVLYLVHITLSAVALRARWTMGLVALSVVGFATLFLVGGEQHMHHNGPAWTNKHLQGMWMAFVVAALLMASFVQRIAAAIAAQRQQISELRERNAHQARVASIATLAAGAAHELNSPLSTIAVAAHEAGRALASVPAAAVIGDDLALINAEVDRCQDILHQLAARADQAGRVEEVTCGQLIVALRNTVGQPRIQRVVCSCRETEAVVTVPLVPWQSAVASMIHNALAASPPEAMVAVELAIARGSLQTTIRDQGAGMTSDVLARAGEPFFTTKEPGAGLGLGLFLARSFFESAGGSLSLQSAPALGTTVTAVLPVGQRS